MSATALFALPSTASTRRVRAIAFDAFPIFDPRPIFALCDELFPGKGADLANAWRTRVFEYTWLRTITGRYADFWRVTEDALVVAAKLVGVEMTPEKNDRLTAAWLAIRCWPDAPDALGSLRAMGVRLALLSNMTGRMLQAGIRNSGLDGMFEHVLSTDRVKLYKPDPHAYQMGVDAFHLRREEILFAAFAGWDASGAKAFGFPVFWVNRENRPAEELSASADFTGATLMDLVRHVKDLE